METKPRFPFRSNLMRFATQPDLGSPRDNPSNENQNPNISINSAKDEQIDKVSSPIQIQPLRDSRQPLQVILPLNRPHTTKNTNNNPLYPNACTFLQESLRGNRILQIPSETDQPETNQAPSQPNEIIIPVENIIEENTPETRPTDIVVEDRQIQAQESVIDTHDESISKTAVFRVGIQFFFNLYILTCYVLGYFIMKDKIQVQVLLGATLGFIFVYMIALIKTRGFSTRGETSTFEVVLSVGNSFALAVYILAAILKLEGYEISLSPFSSLGAFVLLCSCCKSSFEAPSPAAIFFLMDKSVLWIELFLIGLKIDGLSIPWNTVLIPLYFVLMILIFSSLLIIFGSFFAFCSVMREEGPSAKLIIGSFWYMLNAFYTAVWLGIANEGGKELDSRASNITLLLKIGMIHSGVLLLFNLLFWRLLCKFQEFEVQGELLEAEEEEEFGITMQNGHQSTRIRFQTSKEDRANLVMISPTFFTYFKKGKKGKNDRQSENVKKGARNPNPGNQNLALNSPYASEKAIPSNFVFSPTKQFPKNLDYSEGDIDVRKNLPHCQPPMLKKGESVVSSENLCTICYDTAPNAVFMDCGHGGICYECALESWKKNDNCILCRQRINKVLKIMIIKPFNVVKVIESTKKVVEKD